MMLAVHDVATQTKSNSSTATRSPANRRDRRIGFSRRWYDNAAVTKVPASSRTAPRPARKRARQLFGNHEPGVVRQVERVRKVADVAERAGGEKPGDGVAHATDSGPHEQPRASARQPRERTRIHACRVELGERDNDEGDRDDSRDPFASCGPRRATHGQRSDEASEAKFPETRQGRVIRRRRLARRDRDRPPRRKHDGNSDGDSENGHTSRRRRETRDEKHDQGEKEIELLFDGERPELRDERREYPGDEVVATGIDKAEVRREQRCPSHVARQVRIETCPENRPRDEHRADERGGRRRNDPPDPAGVKVAEPGPDAFAGFA